LPPGATWWPSSGSPARPRIFPCAEVVLPDSARSVRIAVATGAAFSFLYEDTLDALRAAGAEVVPFDPLHDERLPEAIDGLIVGGGFPEAHVAGLAANRPLLADARHRIAGGLVTLDDHTMVGAVDTRATMTDRLTLGYRDVQTRVASPLGPVGTCLRGHEFHYSRVEPDGDALALTSRFGAGRAGFATAGLVASYVHHHPGGDPAVVAAFVDHCRAASGRHQ
jgi:cobyrinic acid a,c-diamide synthase